MATLGEGYRALGAGMSSQYQRDRDEMKKLMKLQQRQQLLTAALTPIAQGVGQFATDLISAPFKEPVKQFMNTAEGRQLKTIKAARRADQQRVAARQKLITESGLDEESFIRQEVATNVDAQMTADLGDDFTNNGYLFAKERYQRIEDNTAARLAAWQDAKKKVATVYTDDEWRDIISEYNPEPSNLGQGLWQGGKRLLGFGKSKEESRRDAFDEILTYFELDPDDYATPELTKKTLNEIRSDIVQGVRPFNAQEIDQQLRGDYKDNAAFQRVMTRRERVKNQYEYFSENHSDLFLNAYNEAGKDVQKALRIVDRKLADNADLPDPTNDQNRKRYVADYIGDELSKDVRLNLERSFYRSMYPETDFEDLTDKQKADYVDTVKARMNATISTAYSYGTRAAARQIEELKKSEPTAYATRFADPAKAELEKTNLIFTNMQNLLENHLAEIEIVTDKGSFGFADKTMSIFSGQLSIPKQVLGFEERATVGTAPAGGASAADPNAAAVPAADSTGKEKVELPRGEAIVAQYEAGDTAQAFKTMRSTIKQDIKNRKFSSAEEAVAYGVQASQDIADDFGLPNPLTTGTGRPAVKNSVFAQDGDTERFTVEGGTRSLLGRDVTRRDATYTLSLDDGQVNVSVSQPGEMDKRPITLEEIPEGNIKNHLTYLKMTYQGNIEELQSLGVDEPQSRSLSGLSGRALELKKINNELLGAIDLPGLGDRGDVISFLTATPYKEPEKPESLLSDPTEQAPAEASEAPDASTVEQVAAEVSKLFNDGRAATALLRETAIQESNMGQTAGTYDMVDDPKFGRGSFGVGQVDERNFEDTLARLRGDKGQPKNLVKYVQRFKDKLGIDLTEVEYEDLADPKLGLIFTRLHYFKTADPVPPTVQGRAKYWKKFYNTSAGAGTPDEYLSNQEAYAEIYGDD